MHRWSISGSTCLTCENCWPLVWTLAGRDQHPFIPVTTRALSRAPTGLQIEHKFEEYEGDHANRRGERTVTHLLPFFTAVLRYDVEAS